MTPPILAYPTRTGKFILQTDSSGYRIGAILSQEQDGHEEVIVYSSKTLCKSQQNFCTTMRELYAVVHFLRYYKHYLMGRHFEIHTDHASLVWIKNFKDADGMLSQWLTIIHTFDFTIFHRTGSQMHHVDAFSRILHRKCKREACMDCCRKSFNDPLGPSTGVGNLAFTSKTALSNQSKDEVHVTIVGTLSAELEAGPWTPTSSISSANSDDRSPTPTGKNISARRYYAICK